MRLTTPIDEASEGNHEIVVVGSGPAAAAVVEYLYDHSECRITVLERGAVGLTTHFNNEQPNYLRRRFVVRNGSRPWMGDMVGGLLLMGFGGRGTVAGANRPRFYADDFDCFENGRWPRKIVEAMPRLFELAELKQRVNDADITGGPQRWAEQKLSKYQSLPPRIAVDKSGIGFSPSRGYDSAAARLVELAVRDNLSEAPRLQIVADCYVAAILHDGFGASGLSCYSARPRSALKIRAEVVVLAASAIESARIVLNSELDSIRPAVGQFLAEHLERRAKVRVQLPPEEATGAGISLVLPPLGRASDQRFQIHLRGEPDKSDNRYFIVDIGGFAAMDPQAINRVSVSTERDDCGVRKAKTHLVLSSEDRKRADNMCQRMEEVMDALGGVCITKQFPLGADMEPMYVHDGRIEVMAPGRSYHEAGTLRMCDDDESSACDVDGRLHGTGNVYAADASLFPCVGVASPILTTSALAYWVTEGICKRRSAAVTV